MKVKVCGMREPDNIHRVSGLPISWMGFIFYAPSPRYAAELAPEALRAVPPGICKVGVFVNESIGIILDMVRKYGLDAIQLHGNESVEDCILLRCNGLTVIKAFSLSVAADLQQCSAYSGACDYYVFDTKTPLYGGSGKQYDWSVLNEYTGNTPFLLSGGIGPEDAERLLAFSHPMLAGIDLNSRFEEVPGRKDISKLETILNNIQNGNKQNK